MDISGSHKRSLILAASLAALPGIAAAQTVQIYGTVNVDVETVAATGATAPGQDFKSRGRVTSNSSNIGFRGTENLGGNLSAFFQVESQVNVDDGTSSGFWASRNSGVGLLGNWGQFILGQWDSPYKVATTRIDPVADIGIGGYSGIIGSTGGTTAGQGGSNFAQRASFERRVSNVVQYWTPTWGGVSARFAYGATDSSLGSASTGVAESTGLKPQLFAANVAYENGPLYASLAYEQHNDFQSLNTLLGAPASGGKDTGWKAGAAYRFAQGFTLGAVFEHLEYKADDINGLGELKRKLDNWYVSAKYETGPHNFALAYGQKGQDKLSGAGFTDVPDSKAYQIMARYGYSFSKRTQVYALATRITNESNAMQNFGNSPITPTTLFRDPARGADPTGFGVGMIHTF
jgi:predicted porin